MESLLKGGAFHNRYRITGSLTTVSPLHIGTGEESDTAYSEDDRKRLSAQFTELPKVSTVVKDYRGKPLIPGSSLRGVMRHWLQDVLSGLSVGWVDTHVYTDPTLLALSQEKQIQYAKEQFSRLELIFGTPFNAGKVEVWDAPCMTNTLSVPAYLQNWNHDTFTYIDTSVAIDPATGTAKDKLLYKTELVPPGISFEVNIVGQNLSDEELGLLLFALQGFNSEIYPIQLGARPGTGRGRMKFTGTKIHSLDKSNLGAWVHEMLNKMAFTTTDNSAQMAGYFALKELSTEQCQTLIANTKNNLLNELDKQHG